jgi:signal peptidase II
MTRDNPFLPRTPRRAAVVLTLVLLSLGCDQVTKAIAVQKLDVASPISLLGDVVRLQHVENAGAFLSFGATWPPAVRAWLLTGLVGAFSVAAFVYALLGRQLVRLEVAGLALLVGGGLGNVLDRALRGGIVVDFMNLGIGRLRTGIFNVADLLIEAGVVLLLVGWWQSSRLAKAQAPPATRAGN